MVVMRALSSPSQKINTFFDNIDKALHVYSTYEKVKLGGEFNSEIGENCIDTFMYSIIYKV